MTTRIVAMVLCFAIFGCGSQPILNYNARKVPEILVGDVNAFEATLQRATETKGWQLTRTEHAGVWVAEVVVGKQRAMVEIEFRQSRYSIRYKSSQNISVNTVRDTIDPKYNQWVRNLSHALDSELDAVRDSVKASKTS